MDSAGKKKQSNGPVHGPPLQARVAAANRTVLQTDGTCDDPGAHGMDRGHTKQNERGQELVKGSGHGMAEMAGKGWTGTQPAEQALQANTAGGLSARHRPQNYSQQLAGLAAKQWPQTKLACLSPCSAGRWGECNGAGSQEGGCRPTYTVPTPPIAFACHCPYPLP